jgi:hypothetical protein
MAKEIEIAFSRNGVFVAKLLEEEAPRNCKTLWDALPIEAEVYHAAYAGQCVWMVIKDYIDVGEVHKENQRVLGNLPGTVTLDAYGPETTLDRSEINIVTGPFFYPRTPFHGEKPMNRVALITDKLDELYKAAYDIRENGKEKVTIRRRL